jgi:hypothetical protein
MAALGKIVITRKNGEKTEILPVAGEKKNGAEILSYSKTKVSITFDERSSVPEEDFFKKMSARAEIIAENLHRFGKAMIHGGSSIDKFKENEDDLFESANSWEEARQNDYIVKIPGNRCVYDIEPNVRRLCGDFMVIWELPFEFTPQATSNPEMISANVTPSPELLKVLDISYILSRLPSRLSLGI